MKPRAFVPLTFTHSGLSFYSEKTHSESGPHRSWSPVLVLVLFQPSSEETSELQVTPAHWIIIIIIIITTIITTGECGSFNSSAHFFTHLCGHLSPVRLNT
ncbi:hypothetical protein INR49_008791 [Caranx melampygus]|nr:hypothetical protein INR49_008791 [Caranx melampygus]